METLLISNNSSNKWYPTSIDDYKHSIIIPHDTDEHKRMLSNFAYTMQYLEYIEKQLSELKLPAVLKKMLYKSYIISGMGIIELLFTYILKSNSLWNESEWEEVKTFKSNSTTIGNDIFLTETKL